MSSTTLPLPLQRKTRYSWGNKQRRWYWRGRPITGWRGVRAWL